MIKVCSVNPFRYRKMHQLPPKKKEKKTNVPHTSNTRIGKNYYTLHERLVAMYASSAPCWGGTEYAYMSGTGELNR